MSILDTLRIQAQFVGGPHDGDWEPLYGRPTQNMIIFKRNGKRVANNARHEYHQGKYDKKNKIYQYDYRGTTTTFHNPAFTEALEEL